MGWNHQPDSFGNESLRTVVCVCPSQLRVPLHTCGHWAAMKSPWHPHFPWKNLTFRRVKSKKVAMRYPLLISYIPILCIDVYIYIYTHTYKYSVYIYIYISWYPSMPKFILGRCLEARRRPWGTGMSLAPLPKWIRTSVGNHRERIPIWLASGKRLHSELENHHVW